MKATHHKNKISQPLYIYGIVHRKIYFLQSKNIINTEN